MAPIAPIASASAIPGSVDRRVGGRASFARLAVCGAAGALHALSFAPWNLWWLEIAALAALFYLLARPGIGARAAALHGWAFGVGWFAVGVSWVYISMHRYGEMPAVLAGLATAAFAAGLALLPALGCAVAVRVLPLRADGAQDERRFFLLAALPAAWAAADWVRGVLFTGFPWIASGYAHSDGPLAGYGPLVGVYGMGLAAAVVAGAIAQIAARLVDIVTTARARRARGIIVEVRTDRRGDLRTALALAIAVVALGAAFAAVEWTKAEGDPVRVRLVQGNIPQDLKFSEQGLQRAAETHARLLRGDRVDLAVLPESVYPLPINALPEHITRGLIDVTRTNAQALVFGVFIEDPPGTYYNSAVALTADGPPQRYSKRHLVPFGEFIPTGFRWFVDLMQMPIGDQARGEPYQRPFALAGQRIAANICYEDLFGAEIIDAWRDPAHAPTLLLNLSNLAWFDDSRALPQHLQISRVRAIETGRPMLRATNTGATAVIDARGRVVAALPFNTEGALVAEVRGHTGTTPYVQFGNWPALAAMAALLIAASLRARRVPRR